MHADDGKVPRDFHKIETKGMSVHQISRSSLIICCVQVTCSWSYTVRNYATASQIWNMLPPHLKNSRVSREQFKSGLKTVVTCKIKHLQNNFVKNVLVFYFTRNICKTFTKCFRGGYM